MCRVRRGAPRPPRAPGASGRRRGRAARTSRTPRPRRSATAILPVLARLRAAAASTLTQRPVGRPRSSACVPAPAVPERAERRRRIDRPPAASPTSRARPGASANSVHPAAGRPRSQLIGLIGLSVVVEHDHARRRRRRRLPSDGAAALRRAAERSSRALGPTLGEQLEVLRGERWITERSRYASIQPQQPSAVAAGQRRLVADADRPQRLVPARGAGEVASRSRRSGCRPQPSGPASEPVHRAAKSAARVLQLRASAPTAATVVVRARPR